jgi:serine protease inhibitor
VPYAAFAGTGEFFDTPKLVPADGSVLAATYPDVGGFQAIELPYKGGDLAMVVLLPRSPDGLARLEQLLTADRLTKWLGRFTPRGVDTALPRFQQRSQLELSASLRALGMARAFVDPTTGAGAQFEGINGAEDPSKKLFVGAVFHQAFVEVTEKGTEAVAATAMAMACGDAEPSRVEMVPFRPVFRADHPFLFLIRDAKSGTILFLGRMLDPEAGAG